MYKNTSRSVGMQSGMEKVFLPPRERVNGSAVPAAVTQEARLTPIPGVGIFALGGRGAFCRLRRREGCCRAAAGALQKGGTGHPDLRPGFLYPLLRLPLTFRSAAQRSFAAKKRGMQLRPRYHLWRTAAVWGWLRARFPRITVRGSGCRSDRWDGLHGFSGRLP